MKRRRFVNPFQGGLLPELLHSLRSASILLNENDIPFVVIGGISLAFHFPQYPTDDVDLAVLSESNVPTSMEGFKTVGKHMFENRATGVIVDIVTFKHIDVPLDLLQFAMDTAITYVDNATNTTIPIATSLAVFGIKLTRGRIKDQAHLMWMMRHGYKPREEDLINIGVPEERIELYHFLMKELEKEIQEEKEMGW